MASSDQTTHFETADDKDNEHHQINKYQISFYRHINLNELAYNL